MNLNDVKLVEEYADIIQVGARNVQNFDLLKAVGKAKKPVSPQARHVDDYPGVAAERRNM